MNKKYLFKKLLYYIKRDNKTMTLFDSLKIFLFIIFIFSVSYFILLYLDLNVYIEYYLYFNFSIIFIAIVSFCHKIYHYIYNSDYYNIFLKMNKFVIAPSLFILLIDNILEYLSILLLKVILESSSFIILLSCMVSILLYSILKIFLNDFSLFKYANNDKFKKAIWHIVILCYYYYFILYVNISVNYQIILLLIISFFVMLIILQNLFLQDNRIECINKTRIISDLTVNELYDEDYIIYKPFFLDDSANIKLLKFELPLDDVLLEKLEVVGYTKVTNGSNESKDNSTIYVVVNLYELKKYKYLKLKINVFTKSRVERIYLNIKFDLYEHIFYIDSVKIKNIRKKTFLSKKSNTINDVGSYNSIIYRSLPNMPYIGKSQIKFSDVSNLQSSFLFQNGKFGSGKTTKAIINLCDDGKRPIIISPWEDNSYGDFLYSIFAKLKKVSNKNHFNKIAKQSNFIFLICFLPVVLGFNDILIKYLDFGTYRIINMFNLLFFYKVNIINIFILLLLDVVLFIVMRYLIYPRLCHKAIILKKDFNTHYKTGLVQQVIDLLDYRDVLVIEDIDRLDVEKIKQVFQDIAHLNKEYMKNGKYSNKCIGIVSFDEPLMKKKFKAINEDFDDYKNKLFLNEVYSIKDYDLSLYKECIKQSFDVIEPNEDISSIDSSDSFRKLNVELNKIADKYKKRT